MMNEETHEKLRRLKQEFRFYMNGVAAQSMRQKGAGYHLNWGVQLSDLRKMAAECGKDYDLAIELWKENIRECKILATLIMPPERMLREVVDLWMEQTSTQEVAEQAVFNLYQYLDYAPVLAFEWMASNRELTQMSGFLVLARLFMGGRAPDERGINEFLDQAISALHPDNPLCVRRAAANCVRKFADLGEDYEKIAQNALKNAVLTVTLDIL